MIEFMFLTLFAAFVILLFLGFLGYLLENDILLMGTFYVLRIVIIISVFCFIYVHAVGAAIISLISFSLTFLTNHDK